MKIRRDKLMRLAKAGKLVMVGSYRYDEMSGQQISKDKRLPVRFSTGYGDFIEGQCNLKEHDFTSHSGYVTLSNDGKTAHLGVHSNCSFELQMADGSPFGPSDKAKSQEIPDCPVCNGQRELNGAGGYICCFCGTQTAQEAA